MIRESFYDEATNHYCGGVQGADAFALDLGLGNEAMLNALAAKYDEMGCFDTGIFGTEILIRMLLENDRADTALRLLTSEKPNSFGDQMRRGQTTLSEYWDDTSRSLNHHMFGACASHVFRYLLGIRMDGGELSVKPVRYTLPIKIRGTVKTKAGTAEIDADNEGVAVNVRFGG